MVADTSGLLALFNAREPAHEAARHAVAGEIEPMVVSPYVVAELDYLVATRLGVDAELAVLDELAGGAYHLAPFAPDDVTRARTLVDRYRDQAIGLTDASLVVLADRHRTRSILTLDRRHFDVLRALDGRPFRVVP
ncbi:MAG: PIN domain-containing protein [Actinomycetota bacterium]|nr:PIN domain-containing protein [Actinomycetota bacterium]